MNKKTLSLVCGVVLVALAVGPAFADILPGELTLLITEPTSGEAYICNERGSDITFDGYEIKSTLGLLDPSEYYPGETSGWRSFGDWLANETGDAFTALGSFTWGELLGTTTLLAEVNLTGDTTLANGACLYIGYPAPNASESDLSFQYSVPTDTNAYVGNVVVVPEPATLALLVLGSAGIVAHRRKAASFRKER